MATALIAAVSLALVLVAAVVVPFVVMPGLTGFHDWPQAGHKTPSAQVVSVSLASKPAVRVERAPRRSAPRAVAPHQQLAQATPPVATPAPKAQTPTRTQPAQPVPQAAPEAPLPAPVVDARDHHVPAPVAVVGQVQADLGIDGTNKP
jgi:hypothetical protein